MRPVALLALTVAVAAALLVGCALPLSSSKGQDDMPPSQGRAVAGPTETKWHYQVLHRFSIVSHGRGHGRGAAEAYGGLLNVNDTLYGTTELGGGSSRCRVLNATCGTIYGVSTSGAYRVVHNFRTPMREGANPEAGLIDVNGRLYGTALEGGSLGCEFSVGCGAVYSVSTTGAERVLHSFAGYGTDGAYPNDGDLLYVDGTLYGTTQYGGNSGSSGSCNRSPSGCGVVYSITTNGKERVLYSFQNDGSDGVSPSSGLINVNGTLYGTTDGGGTYGCGTVYSVTTSGQEKVLHNFTYGTDGCGPKGLVNVEGALYGTTYGGGSYDDGTVYRVTTTGKEKTLYTFRGDSDGAFPNGPLVDGKGTLYGTTQSGGGCSTQFCGTVYSVTTAGAEKVLYRFTDPTEGFDPDAPLINVNGTLYSTTLFGGGASGRGNGVIFALSP